MTGKLCPAAGFARRSENYEALLETCSKGRSAKISMHEAVQAAVLVCRELPSATGLLLVTYLTHLDFRDRTGGSVWPGTERIKLMLGCSDATLRRHKAALEKAGLALRKYDQRNRPIHGDAIDLTPFLENVPAILEDHQSALNELKQQHAEARLIRLEEGLDQNLIAQVRNTEHHRNSKLIPVSSGDFSKEEDQRAIDEAFALSPRLQSFVESKQVGEDQIAVIAAVQSGLDSLLMTGGKGNVGHSWQWALNRFGAGGALLRLAITLETPKVRSLSRYFGKLATSLEFDLSVNIQRIKDLQAALTPDLPAGEGPELEFAQTLLTRLPDVSAFNAWFGASLVQYRDEEETLYLTVPSEFYKKRVVEEYGPILRATRVDLGWAEKRIAIEIEEKRS